MKKTLTLLLLTLSCHILNAQNLKLYDVSPGSNVKGPIYLHAGTDKLYFYAYDTTGYDVSLYSIDKKDNITQHTSTFRLWANSSPNVTTVNSNVIFTHADTVGNLEPYILYPNGQYNLTEDLNPNFGSVPRNMTTLKDKVYFVAYGSNRRENLFEYDDKTGKIKQLSDIYLSNYDIRNLIAHQDRLYFCMRNKVAGDELYTYDPKLQIYWRLSNITPQAIHYSIAYIKASNNKLYFTVEHSSPQGSSIGELSIYEYDGIHEPSVLPNSTIKNLQLGYQREDNGMEIFDNSIYINPGRFTFNKDLLRYSLLANTVDTIPNTNLKNSKYFVVYHGKLYMNAYDKNKNKHNIHYYTGAGELINLDLPLAEPTNLTIFNDNLYFVAQSDDSTIGTEIFRFNDSALTVENVLSPLSDIQLYPNPTSGNIQLQFSSKENRDLEIVVTDIQGRTVYTGNQKARATNNNSISISCIDFADGTYICTIKDNSGRLLLTKKFVKQ